MTKEFAMFWMQGKDKERDAVPSWFSSKIRIEGEWENDKPVVADLRGQLASKSSTALWNSRMSNVVAASLQFSFDGRVLTDSEELCQFDPAVAELKSRMVLKEPDLKTLDATSPIATLIPIAKKGVRKVKKETSKLPSRRTKIKKDVYKESDEESEVKARKKSRKM
jgi:hypothetical protein